MRAVAPLLVALAAALPARGATVYVATVDADISPAIGDYIRTSIERAADDEVEALVIQLDTPGGLLSTTQDIVSEILNAPLPVIVFVAPRGAWAASAGTFITLAAHVAAMAPGTSIGAAHPVELGGAEEPAPDDEDGEEDKPAKERRKRGRARSFAGEKAENFTAAFIESIAETRGRNVEWAVDAVRNSVAIKQSEALERKVIDLVAEDLDDLLARTDGRVVKVGTREVTLATAKAKRVEIPMTGMQRFLAVLANPQLATLLFLLGLAGIYIEAQSPGLIVPGVLGLACLVLFAVSLQIIPFNWFGLILLITGVGLMIGEIFVAGFGLLFVPGLILFGVGAYMVFRVPEISDLGLPLLEFVAPLVVVTGLLGALLVYGVTRSFARPQVAGVAGMIGLEGVADGEVGPDGGRVLLRGELWNARSQARIAPGGRVEVEGLDGLTLRVRPAGDSRERRV
jgi:membrane-bound serine protease (ClpP class)